MEKKLRLLVVCLTTGFISWSMNYRDQKEFVQALKRNHYWIVQYYVEQDDDIVNKPLKIRDNRTKKIKNTLPLILVATHGHLELLNYLLLHGAEVNKKLDNDYSIILWSLLHKNGIPEETVTSIVDRLIQAKANVNADTPGCDFNTGALECAVSKGYGDAVKLLLEAKANINLRDGHGIPALHQAALHGLRDIIRLLIVYDADVNITTRTGQTALDIAAAHGDEPTAVSLIAANANVNHLLNDFSPLHFAVIHGHAGMVTLLLANGALVNLAKISPLHVAVSKGETKIAELLLNDNADINAIDKDNSCSVLHKAVFRGETNMIRLLLSRGIDYRIGNDRGKTAYKIAQEIRKEEVLEAFEDFFIQNKLGNS